MVVIDLEEELPNTSTQINRAKSLILEKVKKQHKHNVKKIPEKTAAHLIFEQTLQFLSLFGLLIGTHMKYDWTSNPRFKFTWRLLVATWTQLVYTQFLHIYNRNNIRTLEVFALYGVAISVI